MAIRTPIDPLAMTDIVMPEMDGEALFQALKTLNSDVRVVILTGYPLREQSEELLSQGVIDLLHKPISLVELAHVVNKALQV